MWNGMMDGGMMGWSMMAGMGLIWLLIAIVLVLSAAALVKYLFSGGHHDTRD